MLAPSLLDAPDIATGSAALKFFLCRPMLSLDPEQRIDFVFPQQNELRPQLID